ncbi:hypothetical protein FHS43_004809 [Streptosporangium becharense]|uniref:Uncharacterized protein n=1 Tax=Streptosporangium becharense TaxID=1816182 RepID=A0A7W9IIS0_9ACTN|nr:hypothetical protein [Streptosporangium becharense]MBB2913505.1 hypothetical protein [Streptosporangium becharense]MBB5821195.1 hypothetical protein [Streptosporangium becharense]
MVGVTAVAMGRGGELAEFAPDVPPLNLPQAGSLGAVDFMTLQLPVSLVGYHTQSVDETLNRVANALSERDTRIAVLEQRVSELLASRLHARQDPYGGPPAAVRAEPGHGEPAVEAGHSDGPRKTDADAEAGSPDGTAEAQERSEAGPETDAGPETSGAEPETPSGASETVGAEPETPGAEPETPSDTEPGTSDAESETPADAERDAEPASAGASSAGDPGGDEESPAAAARSKVRKP